jgi:hypothetical protein
LDFAPRLIQRLDSALGRRGDQQMRTLDRGFAAITADCKLNLALFACLNPWTAFGFEQAGYNFKNKPKRNLGLEKNPQQCRPPLA